MKIVKNDFGQKKGSIKISALFIAISMIGSNAFALSEPSNKPSNKSPSKPYVINDREPSVNKAQESDVSQNDTGLEKSVDEPISLPDMATRDGYVPDSGNTFVSAAYPMDFISVKEIETEVPQDLYDPLILVHSVVSGEACTKGSMYKKTEGLSEGQYITPKGAGSDAYAPVPEMLTVRFKKCFLDSVSLKARPKAISGELVIHYFIDKPTPTSDPKAVSLLAIFEDLEVSEGITGVRYSGSMNVDTEMGLPSLGNPTKNFEGYELIPSGEYEGKIPSIGLTYRMFAKDLVLSPYIDTSFNVDEFNFDAKPVSFASARGLPGDHFALYSALTDQNPAVQIKLSSR